MMRPLLERLEARAAAGRPVTVALAGAGRFGTSIAAQMAQMDGLRLAAVADPDAQNGADALRAAGWADEQWERCESAAAAVFSVRPSGLRRHRRAARWQAGCIGRGSESE